MKRSLLILALGLLPLCAGAQEPDTTRVVDLGLSVCWAGYNLGARAPQEYGDYYAWGETQTKAVYDLDTYKYCKGSYESLTKYCFQPEYGQVDGLLELEPADDAAYVCWGEGWRMPSREQLLELITRCKWRGIEYKGVNGFLITGPSGRSIFLPKAGGMDGAKKVLENNYGFYCSRSLDRLSSTAAEGTYVLAGVVNRRTGLLREYGRPVRAVWEGPSAP